MTSPHQEWRLHHGEGSVPKWFIEYTERVKKENREDFAQKLREIAEIYIGMDGIGGTLTVTEAYQEMKLKEMYDELITAAIELTMNNRSSIYCGNCLTTLLPKSKACIQKCKCGRIETILITKTKTNA